MIAQHVQQQTLHLFGTGQLLHVDRCIYIDMCRAAAVEQQW